MLGCLPIGYPSLLGSPPGTSTSELATSELAKCLLIPTPGGPSFLASFVKLKSLRLEEVFSETRRTKEHYKGPGLLRPDPLLVVLLARRVSLPVAYPDRSATASDPSGRGQTSGHRHRHRQRERR